MNTMQGVYGPACVPRGTVGAHAGQAQEASADQHQQAARRFRRLSVASVHLRSGCCAGPGHSVDRPGGVGAAHWCRPPPPRYNAARQSPWQPLWWCMPLHCRETCDDGPLPLCTWAMMMFAWSNADVCARAAHMAPSRHRWGAVGPTGRSGSASGRQPAASVRDAEICKTLFYVVKHCGTWVSNRTRL